ncbi:MAG TPA: hypothetical protein VGC69_13950 [Bordetella sp.]
MNRLMPRAQPSPPGTGLPASRIAGLLVSDGQLLAQAAGLNRLLLAIGRQADAGADFVARPEAWARRYGVPEAQYDLLMARDWNGLLAAGASIYALAKGAKAFGLNLLEIGAAMRGTTGQALLAELPLHDLRDGPAHG